MKDTKVVVLEEWDVHGLWFVIFVSLVSSRVSIASKESLFCVYFFTPLAQTSTTQVAVICYQAGPMDV